MANGQEILDEMAFNEHIKKLGDRELSEFIAQKVWGMTQRCTAEDARIAALEGAGKRGALSGGIAGGIIGAIFAFIEYFRIGH